MDLRPRTSVVIETYLGALCAGTKSGTTAPAKSRKSFHTRSTSANMTLYDSSHVAFMLRLLRGTLFFNVPGTKDTWQVTRRT